jgi:8-oxo-dGTP pyrophosphatase MutT (NUDIX family)
MPVAKIVTRGLQRYWRVSRGLTLGAQGCVLDASNRILLIRHTYRPGWHFPGGGVEKNETVETALQRELNEEAGIIVDGRPKLFNIYANNRLFPGDHIALYVVRSWHQPSVPPPNREIAEQGFFEITALPAGTNPPTRLRINEILKGSAPAEMW